MKPEDRERELEVLSSELEVILPLPQEPPLLPHLPHTLLLRVNRHG